VTYEPVGNVNQNNRFTQTINHNSNGFNNRQF
jgi:hypothetical protein